MDSLWGGGVENNLFVFFSSQYEIPCGTVPNPHLYRFKGGGAQRVGI